MILPVKVNNVNCFKRLSYIHSLNDSISPEEQIKDSFFENPDYVKVYRNFDYSKTFDIWSYNGTSQDKIVSYKKFTSYPYDTVQFRIGDYISFDYRNDGTYSHFLIESCDYQKKYDITGRMWLTNQFIKWISKDGELYSYRAVFEDALSYVNFKYGSPGFVEPNGSIVVLVTKDDNTNAIYINQRFLFNGAAYMVKQVLKSLDDKFMEIYMFQVPLNQMDDIENNIAYNGEHDKDDGFCENDNNDQNSDEDNVVDDSIEILITPDCTELSVGDSITLTADVYVNGVKSNRPVFYSIDSQYNKFIKYNQIDSNSFYIECLKEYTKSSIPILCKDSNSETIVCKNIWLVEGGWL